MERSAKWTLRHQCFAFSRGLMVLLLVIVAGSAASYCPTAQLSCHTTDGTEAVADQTACVLACGIPFEADSKLVEHQRVAFQVAHDVLYSFPQSIETEPDVPPPRTSI